MPCSALLCVQESCERRLPAEVVVQCHGGLASPCLAFLCGKDHCLFIFIHSCLIHRCTCLPLKMSLWQLPALPLYLLKLWRFILPVQQQRAKRKKQLLQIILLPYSFACHCVLSSFSLHILSAVTLTFTHIFLAHKEMVAKPTAAVSQQLHPVMLSFAFSQLQVNAKQASYKSRFLI